MKVCSNKKCFFADQLQPFGNFHKDKTKKTGYRSICNLCRSSDENKEKQKINYHLNTKERIEYAKEYRKTHKNAQKLYYQKNKEKIISQQNEYQKKRSREDINYKLQGVLRARTRAALKKNFKYGSAVADLGCSIEELKQKLESMFYSNSDTGEMMTWKNYGRKNGKFGWDIDHVKPLSRFDLTDKKQFLEAIHYTNLQPMWHIPNIQKGNKV